GIRSSVTSTRTCTVRVAPAAPNHPAARLLLGPVSRPRPNGAGGRPTQRIPMLRVSSPKRRGVVTVEAALVFPIVILLLLGLIVGAMGIFRYQQVAWLAREGA